MPRKSKKRGIEKEIEEIEKWILERRRFFIKLGIVIGVIAVLLIVSHIYLRVKGLGLW